MAKLMTLFLLLLASISQAQFLNGDYTAVTENNNNENTTSDPADGLGPNFKLECPFGSEFNKGYCERPRFMDPLGRIEKFCPEGTQEAYNPRTFYPECLPTGTYQSTKVFKDRSSVPQTPCQQSLQSTDRACRGAELMELGSVANVLAQRVAAAKASGNMKAACATAKQINSFSFSSNAAMAKMCASAIKQCRSTCISEGNGDSVTECESYEKHTQLAANQAVQSAQGFAKSSECVDVVSGSCTGQAAFENENCPEFCQKPGRQNHSKCAITKSHCANSNFAAQNVKLCVCLANPLASICNNTAPTNIANHSLNSNIDSPNFSDLPQDYGTKNQNHEPTPAKVQDNYAYVDGTVSTNQKSFAMDTNQDEPLDQIYDTEVLRGTNGYPALGTPESIYGYDPADYEPQPIQSGSSDSNEFNLKDFFQDFLMGNEKTPTRIPASAGYKDQTITKSDGLTNWQKISRRINILRPSLAP